MATINKNITLKHQSNLGEEVSELDLTEGQELTILKEWDETYLCKNDAGQIFHVPKTNLTA
jgi:hypothetical protein